MSEELSLELQLKKNNVTDRSIIIANKIFFTACPPNINIKSAPRKETHEKRTSQCCYTSTHNKGREYIFAYSTPLKVELFKCAARLVYHILIKISSIME